MPDQNLRVRVERLLRRELRSGDLERLFLYVRDRCDGREPIQEIGDFVAHHGERTKGIVTKTVRDWCEISRFFSHRFGPGGPFPVDARRLPPNTPQFLAATMRRMTDKLLKNATGLSRAQGDRLLPSIVKSLTKNPDGTFSLIPRTKADADLVGYLCSVLTARSAFDGERLYSDLEATLKSHSLLQKGEFARFAELKTVIGLFAVSVMHNCEVLTVDNHRVALSLLAATDIKEIQIEARAPIDPVGGFGELNLSCAMFSMNADPREWCSQRLLNGPTRGIPIEVGLDMKLDILS